jgi:site-specific recombinase XerD
LWFQQHRLSRMKVSTVKTMQSHIALYLNPKWSNQTLNMITSQKVNEWLSSDDLSHLSPKSMKHVVTTLCMIAGKKFSKGEIRYPSIMMETEEERCFTPEEMQQLIEKAEGVYKVLYAIAAETGMRAGELYGLEITDIDFIRNQIHVRRSVYDGAVQSVKTQNGKRVVDVQPWLIDLIKQHIGDRKNGLVMVNKRQQAFRNTTVLRRHLHPLLAKLGIRQAGMHAFRHGRVSYLIEHEVPLEIIKAWIGHGSEQMIRRYMHLRTSYRAAALKNVQSLCPTTYPTLTARTSGQVACAQELTHVES